ncbi:hypothetical protein JCM9279_001895, partial [Rhodotorula babjevae]
MARRKQPASRSDDAAQEDRAPHAPRATIADLPPEIVLQIVDLVRQPTLDRCTHPAHGLASGGLFGGGGHPAAGDGDEQPMNPGEALLAMMGGLFGMTQGGGGAAAAAAGGAAQPAGPAPRPFGPNPVQPADDSDDDMPPLEAIPPANAAAASTSRNQDDDDDMPPLESIDGPTSLPARAADDEDDEMPPLEREYEISHLDQLRFSLTLLASPPAAIPTTTTAAAAPRTSTAPASRPAPAAVARANQDDDDDMPPLEAIDGSSSSAPARSGGDDDDDMPPLEEIDGAPLPADVARELERAQAVRAALGPSGGDDDMESDEDDEDDDDYDEDWSDEEDDVYGDEDHDPAASDSDGDDDRIYPDGKPAEPLLPLLFVNRTFLHATRRQLYRTLKVQTPYVASLMHRALAAETPAGWSAADEAAYAANATDVDGEVVRKNYLGDAVRTLSILTAIEGAVSLGRGGAEHYIGLVALSRNVETLILQTRFFKSATKPLLHALSGLSRLKDLQISSSDGKQPFIVTTARLYKLMQRSWPDLEVLIVSGLKPAEDGPQHEEDEMWDIVQDLEDAAWDEKQRSKLGDKDKDEGEGGEVVVTDGAGDKKVVRKPKGLTSLQLDGFNLTGSEMQLLLQDSVKTLKDLMLRDPGYLFSRTQLASTLLQFSHHLTDLDLSLPASWDPAPKISASASSPVYPVRPKDYVVGKPTPEHLKKLSGYTYLLDAVLPYLPKLKNLRFEGPYASTSVFSFFPSTLTHVAYGNCPDIKPQALAKLLNKTVTRTKVVTKPDGAKVNKSFKSKPASGLKCLTILSDDLNWTEDDIAPLETATDRRNICLHLSSEGAGGARFVPLVGGLGGFGGLGGLGNVAPLGAVYANVPAPGPAAAPPPAAQHGRPAAPRPAAAAPAPAPPTFFPAFNPPPHSLRVAD